MNTEQDIADRVSLDPCELSDLKTLSALYVQLDTEHATREGRKAITTVEAGAKLRLGIDAGQRAMLFRLEGVAVGMIIWMDMGDHVFVRNYVIDGGYRRQGLGHALFERFRHEVIGIERALRLEASAEPPQRFWESCGLTVWSTGLRIDPPQTDPDRETD